MTDHSRVGRLGAGTADLTEQDVLERLEAACVHVSVEPELPGALLTLLVLITTMRRMPGRLHLDPGALDKERISELRAAANAIDSRRGLEVGDVTPPGAVRIHIGRHAPANDAIRAVPDGYGVHIARDPRAVIRQGRPPHALGSVTAAAFGAAEAFKDAVGVVDGRRVDHAHLTWCPVSLSEDLSAAPAVDGSLRLDVALAGCGAVGTAIALILSLIDATGDILVMDRQAYGPENIATYSLGGEEDAKQSRRKVDLVQEALRGKYKVTPRDGELETLAEDVDNDVVAWPSLVLAGLDSVAARHAIQRLWPDRIIDAGTGDTAVGLHDVVAGDGPCLMCLFPRASRPSAVENLSELTGLSVEVLGRGDQVLVPEDIADLDPAMRQRLAPHLGKKICNLAQAAGLISDAVDFQAAVTFVAVQAACLAVGRLIASSLGMTRPNFAQYDSLIGPRPEAAERRQASPDCYCQTKGARVRTVRAERLARRRRQFE